MNGFTVAWIIWAVLAGVAFIVIELLALWKGDTVAQRRSLTANTIALITGPRWWNRAARIGLAALLAWLPVHFGLKP